MKRRNHSRLRSVVSSPVTIVIALVLLIFLGRAAMGIHSRASESAARLAEAQTSLAKAQANKADLQSQINSLSTEDGVEASMREKYHAVQPGEAVAVIVDDSARPDMAASSASSSAAVLPSSWWQRMLRAIGL